MHTSSGLDQSLASGGLGAGMLRSGSIPQAREERGERGKTTGAETEREMHSKRPRGVGSGNGRLERGGSVQGGVSSAGGGGSSAAREEDRRSEQSLNERNSRSVENSRTLNELSTGDSEDTSSSESEEPDSSPYPNNNGPRLVSMETEIETDWRPALSLLEHVFVTDVTANFVTVTVKELRYVTLSVSLCPSRCVCSVVSTQECVCLCVDWREGGEGGGLHCPTLFKLFMHTSLL